MLFGTFFDRVFRIFFTYKMMSSSNRDSFISSYSVLMHVICLFSCLIALTGSSRAVLNRGGESEIPHLVPESGPLFLFITYLDTDLFLNCQLCIFYIVTTCVAFPLNLVGALRLFYFIKHKLNFFFCCL